ncbi:hypothetical protein [Streptomyces coeruleorubidus]|uniref:hypothetical protein n=1 Tax=Streptomyces coeruleorubidus TaxID=116188 RepID=UPI0033D087F7
MIDSAGQNPTVDAGVAAVVGAAIGGSLAGLTAIGTSWFALRVARLQVTSQETQAERQRRFEGLRERREPRAKAYADFMVGGQQMVDLMLRGHEDLPGALMTQLNAMGKLRAAVAIWGPQSVADAAAEFLVEGAMVTARVTRDNPSGPEQFMMSSDISGPLNRFIETARAALEDDGNPESAISPPGR